MILPIPHFLWGGGKEREVEEVGQANSWKSRASSSTELRQK